MESRTYQSYFFTADVKPSTAVIDLYSANDLNVPNSNCKYYVICCNTTINTIKSSDFKTNDALTLQLTTTITIKHAIAGSYAQLALTGNIDFSATENVH